MNDKRKPWLVLVTNLLFNLFLFCSIPCSPLASFVVLVSFTAPPARSVCGVVMRLMRNQFPLLPGSLIWRPCIPAALQSRYKYGSWCCSQCLFELIESYFLSLLVSFSSSSVCSLKLPTNNPDHFSLGAQASVTNTNRCHLAEECHWAPQALETLCPEPTPISRLMFHPVPNCLWGEKH